MLLSIVMPVFNEEERVVEAIRRTLDAKIADGDFEVIVVDDGSNDRTMEILEASDVRDRIKLVKSPRNQGKGAAVRLGAEHARGELLAVHDADLEYEPNDFAPMIEALQTGLDASIGTRVWQAHTAYGYWYVRGNRFINGVCNILYNAWLSDFGAGPKVVRTSIFRRLKLREPGFGFDAELVARLLRDKIRIYEVPVSYKSRTREEGKKITPMDGVKILGVFLRCRVT